MIALGSDHAGYPLKEKIVQYFDKKGIAYKDFGAYNTESCNYAAQAVEPCRAVQQGECELAVLICGTGIGISIAANKHKGIRAAACSDYYSAKYTRMHNNANVLCLGARVIASGLAVEIIDVFLNTEFKGGKHAERIAYIEEIEKG